MCTFLSFSVFSIRHLFLATSYGATMIKLELIGILLMLANYRFNRLQHLEVFKIEPILNYELTMIIS